MQCNKSNSKEEIHKKKVQRNNFSRQAYWSELPFSTPGDLPDSGIEPTSALAGRFFTTEPPGKPAKIRAGINRKQENNRKDQPN